MSHDQLSKSLITTFFHDFLRVAVPDVAPSLRPGEAIFMDKELFTDWPPAGQRRELDLLARVPWEPGELQILVHVEIESRARAGMDQRMWRYYMQIRLRYDLLVLPIVVNLRGGRPGVRLELLAEGVEAAQVVFPYHVLGLSGCLAEEWLARPEPIAWAFAAFMRPKRWSRAELKIECLRRVSRSGVTGFDKEVLVNWLKTCVKLTGEGAAEYQRLLQLEENKEVREMETTWLGKAEERGVKKGLAQGRAEGLEKGKAQGLQQGRTEGKAEVVEQMRAAVLLGLERRFGVVPQRVRRHLDAIGSVERLAELVAELPLVESVDDLVERDRVAS